MVENRPNHTIRLEDIFGDVTWRLNNKYSECLYSHSEPEQKAFLHAYTLVLKKLFTFLSALMATPPQFQTNYANMFLLTIDEIAKQAIADLKSLEGGKHEN